MTTETEDAVSETGANASGTDVTGTDVTGPDVSGVVVRDLMLRRGGLQVLAEVNFSLGPGLHALVGANGSGKSTLLRALAGILAPARGTITIMGHDLWRDEVAARRALAYLPESPEFFPYLTARELLETAASVRGAGAEAGVERFVAWVGEGALDRPLATLSAGQRRKLALSAALAPDAAGPAIAVGRAAGSGSSRVGAGMDAVIGAATTGYSRASPGITPTA